MRLRAIARASFILLFTGCALIAFTVRSAFASAARRNELFLPWRERWLALVRRVFHLDVIVPTSLEPDLRRANVGPGPRVIVANHRSGFDIVVLMSLFPRGQFLSRGDLARWPVIGYGARLAGTVFVQRDRSSSRTAALRTMRALLETNATLIVFPEGTTLPTDTLGPLHKGFAHAARGLDCELVVVGLAYEPGATFTEKSFGEHMLNVSSRKSTSVAVSVSIPARLRVAEGSDAGSMDGELRRVEEELRARVADARKTLEATRTA